MPERAGHGTRDPTDYYATTPDLARLICRQIRQDYHLTPTRILEPGCGAGTFLTAIRDTWPRVAIGGIEIHDDLADYSTRQGFTVRLADVLTTHEGGYDLIIGNPPFRHSEAFIQNLRIRLAPKGLLVFILRLNFLAGQERYATMWQTHKPAKLYVLPARPGFTPDGKTDATDYMVCVWTRETPAQTTVEFLDNRSIQNKWTHPDTFPDPRKTKAVPQPGTATLGDGVNLLNYPPQTPTNPRLRRDPA